MNGKQKGFTLIELLVVVLIIGVLAVIALPQYQKAVLKSRYTTLMPIAKGIAEGNEAYFMEHGTYAEDPTELPIKGQESYPDGTTLDLQDTDEYTYVLVSRADLPGLHHIIYQHHSKNFPSETHCEAAKDNKLANWVCKDAFKGTKLPGSLTTGYNSYLLDGAGHGITATAAAVLAGAACADGLDEDHCKVTTNADGTKTKKECEDPSDTATCTWTTFNTDGTKTVCDGNNATYTSSGCVPAGKKGEYETTYDEDGSTIIGKKECSHVDYKDECASSNLYTYNDDGSYQKKLIMCVGKGTIDENGGCTKNLSILADEFYDEHGNLVYTYLCAEKPTSLQCENYQFGDEFINSYDTNNQLSYVKKHCDEYYPNSTMCVPDKLYETGARVPIYEGDVYMGYNRLECLDGIVNGKCDGWYLFQYDDSGTLVIDEEWCEGDVNLVTATCTISN